MCMEATAASNDDKSNDSSTFVKLLTEMIPYASMQNFRADEY